LSASEVSRVCYLMTENVTVCAHIYLSLNWQNVSLLYCNRTCLCLIVYNRFLHRRHQRWTV